MEKSPSNQLAKQVARWRGRDGLGGVCCTSTWVEDLTAAELRRPGSAVYFPTTPCDSACCRHRGTRYPADYVKRRAWRMRYGQPPTDLGFLCDDCWAAWLCEHLQKEALDACGLSPRHRRIVDMARANDMTQAEIASECEVSQQTVSNALCNAQSRLAA